MHYFSGRLTKDGQVILGDVRGFWTDSPAPGHVPDWHGRLDVDVPTAAKLLGAADHQPFTLEAADGAPLASIQLKNSHGVFWGAGPKPGAT